MRYPEKTLNRLFEEQAARVPDAPALICSAGTMTFKQLDEAANALAHRLVAAGCSGRTIGICLERSRQEIVAALAALKAGAAYLPLDPHYPPARLDYFARDAGIERAIVAASLQDRLPAGIEPLPVDPAGPKPEQRTNTPPDVVTNPDQACFLVYTSGSTGRPKAVKSSHRATVTMLHWLHRDHPFAPDERFCHRTTLNFIVSAWEIYGPLLAGCPVIIASSGIGGDAAALVRYLAESGATRVVVVPTLVRAMVPVMEETGQSLPALRRWISVGEPFPAELARRWRAVAPDAWLLNLYGCSETHSAACYVLRGEVPDTPSIPIGIELPYRRIHLLDEAAQPVSPGADGEIYIAGDGISEGYINQPELTVQRFLALPALGETLAYRTGDRARRLADGNLLMLGRVDRQVSIRGHRVELLEIESTLNRHPSVSQSAVVVREIAGEPQVAAYVVGGGVSRAALRDYVRQQLPAAMVPAVFTFLASLPTTPNGKLDALALPNPECVRMLDTPCVPPQTPTESAVSEIWSDVLALAPIGREDRFFDLGGYSNKAVTVILRIRDRFGVELRLETFFQLQSVSAIAQEIDYLLALSSREGSEGAGDGLIRGVIT